MKFNQFGLDARLYDGIQRAGFVEATPIQEKAIPIALAGQDMIATAQTGTGKTAAFVLPILNKLLTGQLRQSRALIITPTRELAEQIHQTVHQLRPSRKIRSVSVYGGVGAASQIDLLRGGCEIIVACPGRLLDHINNKHVKLDQIEFLILDEADRMLDMGFLPDIKRIINHLPSRRQTMLFSATFPDEIEALAKKTLRNPQRIAIGISKPAHTVSHTLYPVPQHLKRNLLVRILKQTDTDSVLIFARTKHRTKRLAQQISKDGYQVTSLHGDRSQNQRQSALDGFKQGRYQIMVATDIAARGLDISSISHVINYDMPDTADAYIHRIGRTGRAEHTGDAFTLCTPEDMDMVRSIERVMKQKLPRETVDAFDYQIPKPDNGSNTHKGRNQARQNK
jgi:ATP-dependent RNA helicase RhlE